MSRQPKLVLASAAVIVVLAAAAVLLILGGRGAGGEAFALADHPARTVGLYHYIEGNQALAAQVPCYCGCGPSLGHESLSDCFLLAGDSGYESHAATCAICLDEADLVRSLASEGTGAREIRAAIDAEFSKYGRPTDTR